MLGPAWRPPDGATLRRAVEGRVVLVTGASSGIGEATSLLLGRHGARVLLVARRAERLEALRGRIEESGGSAVALPTDLTDAGAVDRLVERARGERPHTVVSSAGHSICRSLADSTDRFHDLTRSTDINFLGPARLLTGLLPDLRAAGAGHVVNVSTVSVDVPAAHWSAYTASKTAFEAWLRCVAPEVRVDGVATTSIHFPLVHTPMSHARYRRVPGLRVEDAAGVVARALVTRPRVVAPWWGRLAGGVVGVAQGPYDAGSAVVLRRLRRGR